MANSPDLRLHVLDFGMPKAETTIIAWYRRRDYQRVLTIMEGCGDRSGLSADLRGMSPPIPFCSGTNAQRLAFDAAGSFCFEGLVQAFLRVYRGVSSTCSFKDAAVDSAGLRRPTGLSAVRSRC